MPQGLPVDRLINVSLTLSQLAAGFANLNSTVLMGESDVIDPTVRIVPFSSLAAVGAAFGSTAPEYLAAQAYFSQTPPPGNVYIGRWAHVATSGRLYGAPLPPANVAYGNGAPQWFAFSSAGFSIQVDALASVNVTGINTTSATNMNGIATLINAAMTAAGAQATCSWTGQGFVFKSKTTGVNSKVAPLGPAGVQAMNAVLKCDAASHPMANSGQPAETLLAAVTALDSQGTYAYAINTDACPDALDSDREAVAAYVEASGSANLPHLYCFTAKDPNALVATATTDVGAVLQAGGYQRTFVQWSSLSPYAACSEIALFMTVDLAGENTMITAAYKSEPGIGPEQLSTAQANSLDQKGYNYYAMFNNGVPVVVNGCMICTSILPGQSGANEVYIDEMLGADGLANAIQTDYFNLLAGVPKLPQTDAGSHLGANAIEQACAQFVDNGFLGPGYWQAGGFGQIATGSFLPKGYYVYTPPIYTQAQADRAARKSVPYQVAAKTAGAIHSASIAVTVNP